MPGNKMSEGDKIPLESVSDQYKYKDSAAGAPSGHGAAQAPRRKAAGAPPPGYGAPPGHASPQLHYAQPQHAQPQYAQPQRAQPQRAQPQYAQPQYAQPQHAQPPPQPQYYAPAGSFNAYPQQQQVHPPNVVYGIPTPPPPAAASYGYQQPVYQQTVGAPPPQMMMQQSMGQWTTGLFDCGEDPSNSVITCLLPCITFGQVAEVIDQGTTSCLLAGSVWVAVFVCFLAPCFVSCLWRTKLRAKYNLPQDEIGDLCVHFWCEPCALCQEYRELANRGLDPSLGWEHHRQQMYAPAMQMGAPQPAYMQR